MEISLNNLSKKYHHEWIFKNINFKCTSGNSYAIIGPNGSGKSTLTQVISGALLPSSGELIYHNSKDIPPEEIYKHLSFASPYLELIEEFTLTEFLQFHFKFKPILPGLTIDELIGEMYLENAKNKYIKNFSSGMKQRLKLGLCFYSQTPILLLDEPTSNLDETGTKWYKSLVTKLDSERIVIIASNQKEEYEHCNKFIDINVYK
jgi:ABC-type multidrug transport system ATPase subunit